MNPRIARMVGECADGFHVHPFHSRRWLTDVVRPALAEGAASAGRSLDDVELVCPVFVIAGEDPLDIERQRAEIKRQLGLYGATPAYAAVFELHGFDDLQPRLNRAVRAGDMAALEALITDDVLDTYALSAPWDGLAAALTARYDGVVDRLFPYPVGAGWFGDVDARRRWADVARQVTGR